MPAHSNRRRNFEQRKLHHHLYIPQASTEQSNPDMTKPQRSDIARLTSMRSFALLLSHALVIAAGMMVMGIATEIVMEESTVNAMVVVMEESTVNAMVVVMVKTMAKEPRRRHCSLRLQITPE